MSKTKTNKAVETRTGRRKLRRVLVANRGEIAVRIIRAAREHGMESVAVYSDVDAGTLPTRLADKRIALGGNSAKETYLNQEKLINAAIQSGCDCVHPGYGFFAENAGFAAAVVKAGLVFVGPSAEVIHLMGDKHEARTKAIANKVPVVPGTPAGLNAETLRAFSKKAGFPLMIKAVAGGSGRGMRLVETDAELESKLHEASSEAAAAFSNPSVFAEKAVQKPRHVEIQIFGDQHGNIVHFGERECSLQRRHQKVLEEAPAIKLHPELRKKICESAVRLGKAVSYVGAGTVEYLVEGGETADSNFYFLEMNTRIQVEHAVTEAITGVDLVRLQFRVAEGEELGLTQKDIQVSGHAIEFRLYAEDTTQSFKPVTGTVSYVARAGGPGVREDSWTEAGSRISAYYDSLLSKLTVWGNTREEAIERSRRALSEYLIEGLESTLPFHRWVLDQPDFTAGKIDVKWIERVYKGETKNGKAVGPLTLPPRVDPAERKPG